MKSQFKRVVANGAGAFLVLFCSGCYDSNAEAESVPVVSASLPSPDPLLLAPAPEPPKVAQPVAPNAPALADAEPVKTEPGVEVPKPAEGATNALSTNAVKVVQTVQPPDNLKASPVVQEIIRLAEAGVGEEVLMAYVTNSPRAYQLTSDEIVYLNDLGVSEEVITAMLQRSGAEQAPTMAEAPVTNAPPAPAAVPQVAVTAPPAAPANGLPPAVTEVPADQAATAVAPPQQPVTTTTFYNSLAPYGTWMEVPEYGLVWQPTVVVVNSGWRPYSDRGRWMWTDQGWYWYSDYSWGWAPFHYGRWCTYPRLGWVWVPDTTWGPSWVSWRYTSSHCGWAPLPPLAHYRSGFGFSYHSRSVGISFDFGLAPDCYTFVPAHRFHHRHPRRYAVSSRESTVVYKNSVVVNNYVRGNNNTIINRGFGKDPVVRATGSDLQPVQVRQATAAPLRGRGEHLANNGKTIVAAKPPMQNHGAMRNSLQASRAAALTPAPAVAPADNSQPSTIRRASPFSTQNGITPNRGNGRAQSFARTDNNSDISRMPARPEPTNGDRNDSVNPASPDAPRNVQQPRSTVNNRPTLGTPNSIRRNPAEPIRNAPFNPEPATPVQRSVQANPFGGTPGNNLERKDPAPAVPHTPRGSSPRPLVNRPGFNGSATPSANVPGNNPVASQPNAPALARNHAAPNNTVVRPAPYAPNPRPTPAPISRPAPLTPSAPVTRSEAPAMRSTPPARSFIAPEVQSAPRNNGSMGQMRSSPYSAPSVSAPPPQRSFNPPPVRSSPTAPPVRQAPSGGGGGSNNRRGQDR